MKLAFSTLKVLQLTGETFFGIFKCRRKSPERKIISLVKWEHGKKVKEVREGITAKKIMELTGDAP